MKILVAGIGNIFLSDDGFGVEAVRRMAGMEFPPEVQVADYGIRGMHLAYDLLTGYDVTIMVDATSREEKPGTVNLIELDTSAQRPESPEHLVNAHGMQPDTVLDLVHVLGGTPGRVLLVGCEPESLDPGIGLSDPVSAAIDPAVTEIAALVSELLTPAGKGV